MRDSYQIEYSTIEDGWIMATVPEIPGAITQGATFAEAWENIRDAVDLVLEAYRQNAHRGL